MRSVTYGTKSYPTGLPGLRERQVGIEIGLNLQQILNDVGVRRNTWWGYALHAVFDNVRIPFTSVGMRYDLNHRRVARPRQRQQLSETVDLRRLESARDPRASAHPAH